MSDGKKFLIIGYGNILRRDDGVGIKVVENIAEQHRDNVTTLTLHQLTPELAEEIAGYTDVIFVDAVVTEEKEVKVYPLEIESDYVNRGHSESPSSLLSLTKRLYDKTPRAWGVFIPGINFDFGEEFSTLTGSCAGQAMQKIDEIIANKE